MPSDGMTVLGFLVQCNICPQQAIVATQPAEGWVCPRCAEVVEPVVQLVSVPVSRLNVRCAYSDRRQRPVACSEMCGQPATSAVVTPDNIYAYRCDYHRGILREDHGQIVRGPDFNRVPVQSARCVADEGRRSVHPHRH